MAIKFPEKRQIEILDGDINVEVEITSEEFSKLLEIFYKYETCPVVKLTIRSTYGDSAKFELNNFNYKVDNDE